MIVSASWPMLVFTPQVLQLLCFSQRNSSGLCEVLLQPCQNPASLAQAAANALHLPGPPRGCAVALGPADFNIVAEF